MHRISGSPKLIDNYELAEPEHEMDHLDIHVHACRLFDVQGTKAVAEAALKARSFEEHGDVKEAAIWHRIEAALLEMRGPHQS